MKTCFLVIKNYSLCFFVNKQITIKQSSWFNFFWPCGTIAFSLPSLVEYLQTTELLAKMASILDQYMQASAVENLNPFLGPDVTEPVNEISTIYSSLKTLK